MLLTAMFLSLFLLFVTPVAALPEEGERSGDGELPEWLCEATVPPSAPDAVETVRFEFIKGCIEALATSFNRNCR
jgi:hypothetical protein